VLVRLLDDQILIHRAPADELSQGGVHLPGRDQQRPLRGTVIAVGPGRPSRCSCGQPAPMPVVVGDLVLHQRYAGMELEVDGADCLVLRSADVLGVLELDGVDESGEAR
jgi:chaperonin GroES